MPNTTLTPELIREEILSRLGGSRLEVELDQRDFDVATREAVRVYSRHVPFYRWKKLAATTTQKRYVLDMAAHPGFTGVIDVQFLTRRTDPTSIDVFDPYETNMGFMAGQESYGDIHQRRAYQEDAARIVSAEPEWRGEQEGSEYALYIDIVRNPTQVSYLWCGHYTADDNADTGMLLIPDGDVDWVLDYIEARCMVTLGRVRRKFGGVPNPEGSNEEVDGTQFADEGAAKITELIEQIRTRRPPPMPTVD